MARTLAELDNNIERKEAKKNIIKIGTSKRICLIVISLSVIPLIFIFSFYNLYIMVSQQFKIMGINVRKPWSGIK